MNDEQIIKNLLKYYFDEVEINVMSLSKKIGFKNYKKFDKALMEAYDKYGD